MMDRQEVIIEQVRGAFQHLPAVKEKKMFGKLAFMVNDKLCIAVGKEDIMCRIDPSLHEVSLGRNKCAPVIMRGREMKGYVYIKNNQLHEEGATKYWIDLCLEYNRMITNSI